METLGAPQIIGGIVMILVSIGIIIAVLLQEAPKGGGMNVITGSDSYYNKNQGRTIDAMLPRVTKYFAITFFVVTVVVYALEALLNK